MKRIYFYLFLLLNISLSAQNLVPNPSFEIYSNCPNNQNQLDLATGWYTSRETPDYFNSCDMGYNWSSVPYNYFGFRTPSSGNGYAGFIESINGEPREYIGGQLITPLQIGVRYYVSFKVSLAGEAGGSNLCGINKLGVLFSTVQFDQANNAPICNCAQIYTDSIITDTLNWTRIKGSFVADSIYPYINIGRFAPDSSTSFIVLSGFGENAYYYLDDIAVSEDSSYAYNYIWDEINNLNKEDFVVFYPNPVRDFITIEDGEYNITEIRILNMVGELVKTYSLNNTQAHTINLNGLSQGIYNLIAYTKKQNQINYKLIKL